MSMSNFVAALAQSAIGQKVSEAFLKANPPHDQILQYVPRVQLISYCLNAPALVLTNLIDRVPAWRDFWQQQWLGAYWFNDITASFYLALFLLWWWIGWQIDVRRKPRDRPRMAVILGLPLSLVCLYASGYLLARLPTLYYAGGPTLPISALIWGIVLLFYFVKMLLLGKPQQPA